MKILYNSSPSWVGHTRLIFVLVICILVYFIFHISSQSQSSTKEFISIDQVAKLRSQDLIWPSRFNCLSSSKNQIGHEILIVVNSARGNFESRDRIRKTWGSIKTYKGWTIIAVIFMLGEAPSWESEWIGQKLDVENYLYGDLIKFNVTDKINHLTLKAILTFNWVTEYCPNVDIVVKTDDDVVVNVFQLIKEMERMGEGFGEKLEKSSYYCYVAKGFSSTQNPLSRKYKVSIQEIPFDVCPQFCVGLGWLTTVSVLQKILDSLYTYPRDVVGLLDDVFVTGVFVNHFNSQIPKYELTLNVSSEVQDYDRRISLVQKNAEWYYCPSCQPIPKGRYEDLLDWHFYKENKTKYLDSKIFYLMERGEHYDQDFWDTWNKIKKLNQIK